MNVRVQQQDQIKLRFFFYRLKVNVPDRKFFFWNFQSSYKYFTMDNIISSSFILTIFKFQNPKDCSTAKYVVCDLSKGCGFGCQLHHVTYCLIFAYATQRTLVLQSKGWRYANRGWSAVFEPLSNTCPEVVGTTPVHWAGRIVIFSFHQLF